MKGWEFTKTHVPLKIVEKPDPVAKPGYVVLDVKACGLCHSDVGALEDESWMNLIDPPVIIGHELAGVVKEIGEGVTEFKVGDRVGVCPLGAKDGTTPGYTRDGGYATMSTAPVEQLVPVPDNVNFTYAAAATDAGMTSYHAVVVKGQIKPGMKVGIIGIGGLGQVGARIAVLKGCEVYASSRKPEARQRALDLGCKGAVETALELGQFNLDVIVDFAGSGDTTYNALEAVGFKGRVVVAGMAKLEAPINTMTLITKQAEVVGSNGGTAQDIADVYELMASGQLEMTVHEIEFDEIAEGLETLKKGGVDGRLVAMMNR